MSINVCSACTFRHGYNHMDKVKECCLTTCQQFDGKNCPEMCTMCLSKVSKKCRGWRCSTTSKGVETPVQTTFRECFTTHDDPKEAFRCCLQGCGEDFGCQEKCIDAYNATRPVVEPFQSKVSRQWLSRFKSIADGLTIPFFLLLFVYFVRKTKRTNIEWLLLLFAIVGLVVYMLFTVYEIIDL